MAANISFGGVRGWAQGLEPCPYSFDKWVGEESTADSQTAVSGLSQGARCTLSWFYEKKTEAFGQLVPLGSNALLRFHLRPINVVFFHGPPPDESGWNAHLGAGFALRCFQRLSVPHIATRQCTWRHNRYTRGASVPVLSYWGPPPSTFLRPPQIETELSYDVLNPARVPL